MGRRHKPLAGIITNGSNQVLTTIHHLVLIATTSPEKHLIKGVGEVSPPMTTRNKSYWLRVPGIATLRIRLTSIERHLTGRQVIHFKVLSMLSLNRGDG